MTTTPWGAIEISGGDAAALLQGQLTQDMRDVGPRHWPLAAWCSPRGRALTVCRVIAPDAARFLLPMPADTVHAVARRLSMFVLRADARVRALDGPWLCGALGAEHARRVADGLGLELAPPDGPGRGVGTDAAWLTELPGGAGWELCGHADVLGRLDLPEDFERRRLQAGIPAIAAAVQDAFVPQMLNLDLIGAVRFDKGCYVGQEVVARTQNLGRIKRRMLRLELPPGADAAPGDTVYADGESAGKVVLAVAPSVLAVLPLVRFTASLSLDAAGSIALERQPLPYALPDDPRDPVAAEHA